MQAQRHQCACLQRPTTSKNAGYLAATLAAAMLLSRYAAPPPYVLSAMQTEDHVHSQGNIASAT